MIKFILIRKGEEIIKAWDILGGQMMAPGKSGVWEPVEGSLEAHLKFHPYEEIEEVENFIMPKEK